MIIDLHTHIADSDAFVNQKCYIRRNRANAFLRQYMRDLDKTKKSKVIDWLNDSCLDYAVVLALDGAYRENGTADEKKTVLKIDNDYIADISLQSSKFLFGASVHPYRTDSIKEIERLIKQGACLVKWLPSAQNIQPDNPKCFSFYDVLAHYKIPLLSHTGIEHTLTGGNNAFNDPQRLVPALERGVTVIAAHCGARVFLYEKCYFSSWKKMALEYDNFYGDIGAFILPIRIGYLKTLLKNNQFLSKIIYGSDFPANPLTSSCLFTLGLKKTLRLRKIENPFEKTYQIMKQLGVPDSVFSRAQKLLRFSAHKEKHVA